MMRRIMQAVGVIGMVTLVAGMLSGCATIFSGTEDAVTFDSTPQGATVMIDGLERGKTPVTLNVQRPGLFTNKSIELKLEGYENRTFVLQKQLNSMAFLNLFNGAGWLLDIVTGAITKYEPTNYSIDLSPKRQSYHLEDLEQDLNGSYIIPEGTADLMVIDEANGIQLVFVGQK